MPELDRDRERLQAILRAALERSPSERARFIEEASAGDDALRERMNELLRVVEEETEHAIPRRPSDGGSGADHSDPRLTPGQQLGRYEIIDLLGSGGMGTVYRALDPSLGREVAIKALAHTFRGDSGSLRRFEREARVLAALSHPNIAAIYGFERLDGSPYLVLEHVDGETLAHRLGAGPMPFRESLAVAVQIIEGLEEAHGKGVTHRDLKPSNVMLAPGGRAKLVDFGLAKTSSPRAKTQASAEPITAAGAVVGTARYMSPEQVQGDEVDTRTDVWAFGCVLYEMLSGRAAFPGRSVPEVLAAVLRDEPDWTALPDEVPLSVRRLLRRCLRRNPRERLQHVGDARIELTDVEPDPPALAPARPTSRWIRWSPWVVVALSLTAVGALLAWRPASSTARHPVRLSLELPANVALANEYDSPFAIAPSGSSLALQATENRTTRLYVRSLNDVTLRSLAGTEDARQPFFSPDGNWIGFFADRKLTKVPVGGGPALALADIGGNPRGATWAADGTIVVAPSQTSGLVRISDRGGSIVNLTTLDRQRSEYSHRWPDALPGGKWVLFTVALEDASFDEARIEAVSLETGDRRVVLAGAGFARYLPNGQLLFVRGGRVYAVAFDTETLSVTGASEVVLDAVRYDPRNGGCHLAVSASGVLVYGPGVPSSPEHYLTWLGRDGRLQRAVDTARPFRDPRLSPDGKRIAIVVGTSADSDLWLVDENTTFSRLSFGLSPHRPAWHPDGTRLTVGVQNAGRWRLLTMNVDGSGASSGLLESPNRVYPNSWSADGRYLVYQESRPETGWDLGVLEVDASGRLVGSPQMFGATPFHESGAAFSPDGRWVAYESDEVDGIVQVYARSFPGGAHKIRISSGGARMPAWGRGGQLYYWRTGEGRLHVAHTRVEGERLVVDRVEQLWGDTPPAGLARLLITVSWARFEVDPSGQRFLALETAAPTLDPSLSRPIVVLDRAGTKAPGS